MLSEEDRRLLVEYYQAPSSGRAALRRQLAETTELSADNLRQRTRCIRERVRVCLTRCLQAERETSAWTCSKKPVLTLNLPSAGE
jgi:hypothetical protein